MKTRTVGLGLVLSLVLLGAGSVRGQCAIFTGEECKNGSCSYSTNPQSQCSTGSNGCPCGGSGGEECDPTDPHCVLYQG